jgi:hypothetical protein
MRNALTILSILFSSTLSITVVHQEPSAAFDPKLSGIQKVVVLLREMKAQTVKQGEEDQKAYDHYMCWCETAEKEKTAAIESAQQKIEELESFVAESTAKAGELKTEIAGLVDDIASDTDALATATKLRKEQNDDFLAEEADIKETLALLSEAIGVLSKVQLVQKPEAHKQALIQVSGIVNRMTSKFQGVMQKDLFDMLGEFKADTPHDDSKTLATGSFLAEVFLPKKEAAALSQSRNLPWIKTEEQLGKEADPNALDGNAAGAKSYNSRSGSILGILKTQGDKFAKNLAASQKEELTSLIAFQKLAAAKTAEIAAATEQKETKEGQLADLLDKVAKAKEDIEATTNTLTADEQFLMKAKKMCNFEDEEFARRTKVRNEEVKAIGETLDILTGDAQRTLFDKTLSFVQVGAVNQLSSAHQALQEQARNKAMTKILMISKKHKNFLLATLAVRVKLDAFTKVKAAMDRMLAELKAQQKAEYAKWETCKKDIDTTEDKIWTANVEKRDLGDKHTDLVNTIKKLTVDIAELNHEVEENEISLKDAGEERKAQNELFQATIADQRATIDILNMALKRLEAFYGPAKAALAQVRAHTEASVPPPPPRPSGPEAVGYKKDGTSGGVMQLLGMIIADAGRTEDEMHASEQKAQADYAEYVSATTASIEADRIAISEKEKQLSSAKAEKSETEEAQLGNQATLDKLGQLLTSLHGQCDYIIKYFDIRQQSRAEEMDAIEEAKAILSGADFS